MRRTALLVLIVTGALAALEPLGASAVVGGAPAPPGRWPFMAAIVDSRIPDVASGLGCGGTVIAPRRVLTAAHCVLGTPTPALAVVVGRSRLTEKTGRVIRVTAISVFPGFLRPTQFGLDAAVLTLAEDARVAPVRLARKGDEAAWAPGTQAWTAGWGQINARPSPGGGSYYADRLKELQLPIVADAACESVYGAVSYRPAWRLCAGVLGSGQGTCYGDSGGPLVVGGPDAWLQVGIVQGGDNCMEQGYYDVFTRADRISAFAARPDLTEQPYALTVPRIRGRLKAGARLRCINGSWAGSRARYAYTWLRPDARDGTAVGGGSTHTVSTRDARSGVTCRVTAYNAGGVNESTAVPRDPP